MQEVQLIDSRKSAVRAIDEKGNVPVIFGPKVSNCLVSFIVSGPVDVFKYGAGLQT